MSKLMTAMIAAGLCAGMSTAMAQSVDQSSAAAQYELLADNTSAGNTTGNTGQSEAVRDGSGSAEQASEDPAGSNAAGRRNRDSTQQHSDVTPGAGAGPNSNAENQPGSQMDQTTGDNSQSSDNAAGSDASGDDASGREDNRRNRESTMQNDPGGPAVESGQATTGQPSAQPGGAGDPSDEIRNRDSRKQQQAG
jgi:hypothetical protein